MQPSTELATELGEAGLDIMAYSGRSGRMRVRLTQQDLNQHKGTVRDLLTRAYEESRS